MNIGKLKISEIELASQGNAVLGIRDSGKTYTATWLAERFLDQGIPFVAFDPIGVWRYLRTGRPGKEGYKVVVAGDGGDIPLTAESAPYIVRAAMQENIPLVLDLYSISLSKAAWKQIVEQSVKLLIYENKPMGLRHVFIEEAAEFVPQRVRPDEGRVYAAMEQLARMGRNSSLGYTLINQRAEEVNKSVLELCDGLFLHRQKGRNSLTALSKWLDIADAENGREIIKSLPTLPQGQCWYWAQGSQRPVLITVPEKNTIHPNPKNPEKASARAASVDVSEFITRLNSSLAKQVATKALHPLKEKTAAAKSRGNGSEAAFADAASHLSNELERTKKELAASRALAQELTKRLQSVQAMLRPDYEAMKNLFNELEVKPDEAASGVDTSAYGVWMDKLQGGEKRMLELLIQKRRLSRKQLVILLGVSERSLTNYVSTLHRAKLISKEGEFIVLSEVE